MKLTEEGLQKRLAKAASEVDLQVKYFNKFGKDAIKSWKISPDAFCQMAMQLAVHSLTGEIYPTYESGQTRYRTRRTPHRTRPNTSSRSTGSSCAEGRKLCVRCRLSLSSS